MQPLKMGDNVSCTCDCDDDDSDDCGDGSIESGDTGTWIEGAPVARAGDPSNQCSECSCFPQSFSISGGSSTVWFGGSQAATTTASTVECGIMIPTALITFIGG